MICNLFSSFDPSLSFDGVGYQFKWYSTFVLSLFIYWQYFLSCSGLSLIVKNFSFLILGMVKILFLSYYKKFMTILTSLICLVFFVNELGMINPTFTVSSHLCYNLSLSIPMWLGGLIFMIMTSWKNFFCHLVPTGCPLALIPFLIIIESMSLIIRPISLGVRLMSNIMAGHMILTLIGLSLVTLLPSLSFFFVLLFQGLIFMFELVIAVIQSYVFFNLMSLYWQDNF